VYSLDVLGNGEPIRFVVSDYWRTGNAEVDDNVGGFRVRIFRAQLTPGDSLVIDVNAGTDFAGALLRLDLATGHRTLLSDFGNPAHGPLGADPIGVAVLLDAVEPPPVHDLAVTKLTAPQTVTLTPKKPQLTKPVTVQLQNRSPHNETIPDLATLGQIVTLTVTSLGSCPPSSQALQDPDLPKTLKPKKTLNVVFDVRFDCANDPKTPYLEDR
jgi:hypothetical protein